MAKQQPPKPAKPKAASSLPKEPSPAKPKTTSQAETRSIARAKPGVAATKPASMGRKQMTMVAAVTAANDPPSPSVATQGYHQEQLPKISHVAGAALQADIQVLNQAVIRLLKTAARLGPVEPLAHLLLGTSPQMIELFESEVMGERLLAQSLGFPLVQLRIHDVGVMRQMLSDGIVSASSVQSITNSFPLEVIEAATRRRHGG